MQSNYFDYLRMDERSFGGGKRLTAKGHEKIFWGDESILCLDWRGPYTGTYIHECIQMYNFIVCKLYDSKLITKSECIKFFQKNYFFRYLQL